MLPAPEGETDGTDHDHGNINSLPHDENHPDHYLAEDEAHPDHTTTESQVVTEFGKALGLRGMLKEAAMLAKSGEATVSEDELAMLTAVENLLLTETTTTSP